jgi:hypothetical protein
MHLVGCYRVLQTGVQGLPPGSLVWVAFSDDEVALLDSSGTPGLRLSRGALDATVEGGATRLRQGELDLPLLAPREGPAADALVRVLEMRP